MAQKYEPLVDEIMEITIKIARKNGIDVMGLDFPAVKVRESLNDWFVFAETAPKLPTKDDLPK